MRSMIIKEFRELSRDRRTMAMIVVLPILLLTIFGYAASFNVGTLTTVVVGPQAAQAKALLPPLFEVTSVEPDADTERAKQLLRDGAAQVVIDTSTTPPTAWVDGADLFSAQTANAALGRASSMLKTEILFNPELKTSWYMVPSLIGLILTFIGTIVTSIGLVRERETGTLEQLAVMPFRPVDVIVGKIAPYFVLASIDLLIVAVVGMLLFGVPFNGSILVFALGAALFLFAVLGIGVFISTVSRTTGQAIQLAILTLLPQVLMSGMIFPLIAMPWAVRWMGYLMPLTYFTMISRGQFLRGTPITSPTIWIPLVILSIMAMVIFALAVARFRRDLAPRRSAPRPVTAEEHGA